MERKHPRADRGQKRPPSGAGSVIQVTWTISKTIWVSYEQRISMKVGVTNFDREKAEKALTSEILWSPWCKSCQNLSLPDLC